MNDQPEVLTADEVCGILQINMAVFRREARAGRIPAFKAGREWRVYRPDLIQYMRDQYRNRQSE